MRKLSLLLMVGTFLAPFSAQASDCQAAPDCASLGFTADASKCNGAALKCPWDTSKAACDDSVKTPLPVIYGDGTIVSKIVKGKTPVGVVFDEVNKLAVALTDVKKDGSAGSEVIPWSSEYDCDIPGLENCDSDDKRSVSSWADLTLISCSTDGRLNTDAILASTCGTTYAATAANSYQPTGCTKDFCKKTKWFLPSLRALRNIYLEREQLNITLDLLSSSGIAKINGSYWSSNEHNSREAWLFFMNNTINDGNLLGFTKPYYNTVYVRPVINYSDTGGSSCSADYSLTTCPENAICTSCGDKYKFSSCKAGYVQTMTVDGALPKCEVKPTLDSGTGTGTGSGTGTGGGSAITSGDACYSSSCFDFCQCLYQNNRLTNGNQNFQLSTSDTMAGIGCKCNSDGTGYEI